MIKLDQWRGIPWIKRNQLISKYHITRSNPTKVVGVAPGVDVVEDDGIREGDLNIFIDMTIDQILELNEIPIAGSPDILGAEETEQLIVKAKKGRPKKK